MESRFLMKLGLAFGIALITLGCSAYAGEAGGARPAISSVTRMDLIRLLNAEYAWVRTALPHSEKGVRILPDGKMVPAGRDLQMDVMKFGPIARPGERVQVTNVEIRDKQVYLELNGGAVKKAKWYQRIQVSGNGGGTNIAPGPDNSRSLGTSITVEFKKHVPEMTLAELKQVLAPLLDFSVKSAAQAYTESLPKNVQDAIKDHRVLVGMNKEMVTYAKGRPPQRIREKDAAGLDYEEWIYGAPPADTEFVRFTGEEVTQLKIMRVGGEKIVKTEREVKLQDPALAMQQGPGAAADCRVPDKPVDDPNAPSNQRQPVRTAACADTRPPTPTVARRPTLRRPGEAAPDPQDSIGGRTVDIPTGPQGQPPADPQSTPGSPPQ